MTRRPFNYYLRRFANRLRSGKSLELGPLSVVWTQRLLDLESRGNSSLQAAVAGSGALGSQDGNTRRSIVFLHNAYYNFLYLAKALRKRGWDAVSVDVYGPHSAYTKYSHGADIELWDEDPERYLAKISEFVAALPSRFRMLHFYGRGNMSFFPARHDYSADFEEIPWDFFDLKRQGMRIGYTVSGCNDGAAQSAVRAWSGACNKCVWRDNPAVCSDRRNLAWGQKVRLLCDLIATDATPALDLQGDLPKVYREPLTSALDPEYWDPAMAIPDEFRLKREPGELLVCHGVGEYSARTRGTQNIKGTQAVISAIDRLQSEGIPVRLHFVTGIDSTDVRYHQLQCDIIVDQLNYGRYGASAREGMMLGKPTICRMIYEPVGGRQLQSIEECPLISATEETIYDVLKSLAVDRRKREQIGKASRDFALKWHSADACAEQFEAVYDRMMAGRPVVCE